MLKKLDTLSSRIIVIVVLFCLSLLVINVADGYYLRHSGDDFAFSSEVTGKNPVEFTWNFLNILAGRFSNGIMIYFMYQAPEVFIKITPLLFVSLFIAAAYLFIRRLTPVDNALPAVLISIIFTFCLVMVPANQYQTIYWLPAYISYGLPLALLLLLFVYSKQIINKKINYLSLGLLFLFALFIGGLHELAAILGCILLVSAWCLFAVDSLVLKGFSGLNKAFFDKSLTYLSAVSGLVVSFLINYLAPATAFRRSRSPIEPEGKREMLAHSWDFSVELFQDTLWEPAVIFCLFTVLLISLTAYISGLIKKVRIHYHPLTIYLAFLVLATIPFISLYITALSSRYGYGTPPPERANFIFYFTLILCTTLLGILLASLATKLHRQATLSAVHVSVLILLVITPLSFFIYTQKTIDLRLTVKSQAASFDERERYIEEQVAKGNKDLLVPSLEIGDTPYPKDNANEFPNKPIARYYGLNSLRAYGYPVY